MAKSKGVWISAAGLLAVAAAHPLTSRSGLYNNLYNPGAAMAEHRAAWNRLSCGEEFSRLCMSSILKEYGGACVTEEDVWETVHLDQRLDRVLGRPGVLIGCHIDVRGRLPFDIFGAYRWTTVLEPVSQDRVRLREFRRGRETL